MYKNINCVSHPCFVLHQRIANVNRSPCNMYWVTCLTRPQGKHISANSSRVMVKQLDRLLGNGVKCVANNCHVIRIYYTVFYIPMVYWSFYCHCIIRAVLFTISEISILLNKEPRLIRVTESYFTRHLILFSNAMSYTHVKYHLIILPLQHRAFALPSRAFRNIMANDAHK